jgi:hypothetical protein
MAARAGDDQLRHFVAAGAWDSVPLEAVLVKEADRLVVMRLAFSSSTTRCCRRRDSTRSALPPPRYAFLQARRLKSAGRKKRVGGPPPQPSMPAIRQAILNLFARPPPQRCPHCEKHIADTVELRVPK